MNKFKKIEKSLDIIGEEMAKIKVEITSLHNSQQKPCILKQLLMKRDEFNIEHSKNAKYLYINEDIEKALDRFYEYRDGVYTANVQYVWRNKLLGLEVRRVDGRWKNSNEPAPAQDPNCVLSYVNGAGLEIYKKYYIKI